MPCQYQKSLSSNKFNDSASYFNVHHKEIFNEEKNLLLTAYLIDPLSTASSTSWLNTRVGINGAQHIGDNSMCDTVNFEKRKD